MSTKEQERKALEQIRKIVDGLGPDSYIATAFDGCFEIAEENIENDFACSMKQRVEAVVVENAKLRDKIKMLELDKRDLRLAIKKEKEDSSVRETALQEKVLSDDDLCDCQQLVSDHISTYRAELNEAAERIIDLADNPASKEFQDAVRDHRNAKTNVEYCNGLLERITKAVRA